jgi:transcriptional regulator with XRE-family HTH domain
MTLQEARITKGLTVDEVADELGVTGATVTGWERGEFFPHVSRVADVARMYGLKRADVARIIVQGRAERKQLARAGK